MRLSAIFLILFVVIELFFSSNSFSEDYKIYLTQESSPVCEYLNEKFLMVKDLINKKPNSIVIQQYESKLDFHVQSEGSDHVQSLLSYSSDDNDFNVMFADNDRSPLFIVGMLMKGRYIDDELKSVSRVLRKFSIEDYFRNGLIEVPCEYYILQIQYIGSVVKSIVLRNNYNG
jgi:hypothetical protein